MQKYDGAGAGHHYMLDALLSTVDKSQGSSGPCLRCALAMVVVHSCRHLLGARSAPAAASLDDIMRVPVAGGAAGAAAAAAAVAKQGAESTARMEAGAGRSSYVPASALASTPDPGATAVGVWLGALARVFSE